MEPSSGSDDVKISDGVNHDVEGQNLNGEAIVTGYDATEDNKGDPGSTSIEDNLSDDDTGIMSSVDSVIGINPTGVFGSSVIDETLRKFNSADHFVDDSSCLAEDWVDSKGDSDSVSATTPFATKSFARRRRRLVVNPKVEVVKGIVKKRVVKHGKNIKK
ncbi:hypothetical protein SNE40_019776 [Patella caerulea]|uniref:Uncharacterized protein n=1 Tax=Patella caerulea TaxID=87958 RepID=A0AAN8P6J2_PATCE